MKEEKKGGEGKGRNEFMREQMVIIISSHIFLSSIAHCQDCPDELFHGCTCKKFALTTNCSLVGPSCCEIFRAIFNNSGSLNLKARFMSNLKPDPSQIN